MEINIWSDVKVAVQALLGAAKTITGITKANPAVASSAAHGYTAGKILLLKVRGMKELNYRVVRVAEPQTGTFELEGIDSTNFGTFVSGTAEEITFGAEAATLQTFNSAGGEAADTLIQTIHTSQDYNIPGNRSPLVMTSDSLWDLTDPALLALKALDDAKTPGALLIEFATGNKVYFAAYPSVTLAPTGQAGGPVQTPVKLNVRGAIQFYES